MSSSKALPIHLITGLLGSGKTTALRQLITQKPKEETWGFIINEFGEVDIDAATLIQTNSSNKNDNPIISVAGGCVCCTAQAGLSQAINQLLNQQSEMQPLTRIWIEPTGLGHPAKIIDTLTHTQFAQPLVLQKIVCVISPQQLTKERWQKSAVMRDLVTLSDIILLNKTDLSDEKESLQAIALLEGLYPPKQNIVKTKHSQVELQLLLQPRPTQALSLLSSTNKSASIGEDVHLQQTVQRSQRVNSDLPDLIRCIKHNDIHTGTTTAIGWVFAASTQFNRIKLKEFFKTLSPVLSRAKGILKTGNEWQLINWSYDNDKSQLTFEDIAWRQDSRLECLFQDDISQSTELLEDKMIEIQLLSCISKHA